VDVSQHQEAFDWKKLRAAGIEFAFIKATEGRDHSDTRFSENWEGAGEAGVARGAYHFFTFCTPGLAQAEHFLSRIAPLPAELPPAADVEFSGNCRGWTSEEDIRAELTRFLRRLEESLGRTPIVYLTRESHRRIVSGRFDRYPLWVRDIFFEPSQRRYGRWTFWQFAHNGRLPGVRGLIDLNAFCCSREEFAALR
jgi:lysozyme